ncbi:MAG: hypothetical protein DHS20C18_26560 [Saprospiraceae bacterium]|nr:MAG: hypothetical protein DHS20C18_26560 [Saprospiraceae bacterium]
MNIIILNTKTMQQLLDLFRATTTRLVSLFFLLMASFTSLQAQVTFQVGNVSSQEGDLICVPITVNNFSGVQNFQLSLQWDDTELDAESMVTNSLLPWITLSDFSILSDHLFGAAGQTPPPDGGLNLPNGTMLFEVCFRVLNNCSFTLIEASETPLALEVTDENGEPLAAQMLPGSVNNPRNDLIQSITPDTAICGGDNLQLQVIAPEAVAYQWSTNGNDALTCNDCPNPIVESPFDDAIYSVTVTDAAGCQQMHEVFVDLHQYLDFGLLPFSNSPVCHGGTLLFEPYIFDGQSYLWTGPDGFFSDESHPSIPNVDLNNAGTYTFAGVDDIGCEVGAEFEVTVTPELDLFMEVTDASCVNVDDGQLIIIITGGTIPYTYDLNTPGPGDDPDLFNLSPGAYTITITDAIGCTVDDGFVVGVQPTTEWSAVIDRSQCTNGIDILSLQGPASSDGYAYSLDGGLTFSPIPAGNIQIDSGAIVSLAIQDPGGCIQLIDPSQIEEALFQLFVETMTPAYCNGSADGSVTLESLNGLPVEFEGELNGLSLPDIDFDHLFPGHYEITAYSENNCPATVTFDLPYTNNLTYELDFNPTLTCANGLSTLTLVSASGGVDPNFDDYWLSVNGAVMGNGNVSVDLAPGLYVISINDSSCYADTLIEIVSASNLVVGSVEVENISCLGNPGSISVVPQGGTAPYTYTWWDNQTTIQNTHTVASPGFYSLTITDTDGCEVSLDSVLVIEGPSLSVNSDTIICGGQIVPLVAIAPNAVNFQWSPTTFLNDPNIANPQAFPTETTVYTVQVEDADGCINTDSITITVIECSWFLSDTIEVGDTLTWCDPTLGPIGLMVNQIWVEPMGFMDYNTSIGSNCIDFIGLEAGLDSMALELCYGTGSPCFPFWIDILVTDTPVWPGDTDDNGMVDNFDVLNIGLAIDSSGPTRPNATLNWAAQPSPDWGNATPDGNNYKHSDTDGNGIINLNDTLAISLNWGEVHQFRDEGDPDTYRPLMDVPFYLQPDTIFEGQIISLPLILGTEEAPAEEVYGLAFSLVYNPEIITPNTAFVSISNSWLGALNEDLFVLQKDFHGQGQIDIGLSRTDGVNVSGSGAIGQFIVTIEDDILFWSTDEQRNVLLAEFKIKNVRLINFQGEEIPVDAQSTMSEIISSQFDPFVDQQIILSPNPARDNLNIYAPGIRIFEISFFNNLGQKVWREKLPNSGNLNIGNLPMGSYQVQMLTDKGCYNRKVIISK